MRLIDADKCPCSDCGINGLYNGCTKECIMFKKWIDSTAYDVDKVIDEMEGCVFRVDLNDGDNCMAVELDEAIGIVKDGGKV